MRFVKNAISNVELVTILMPALNASRDILYRSKGATSFYPT
jgi:hypothetical protein